MKNVVLYTLEPSAEAAEARKELRRQREQPGDVRSSA
jgi:hypothetical protein